MKHKFDIVILGGGPAGASAALALKDADLSVAIVDKATFPREKTCGDAIPGPCVKLLKGLMGDAYVSFASTGKSEQITCSHVYPNKGKKIEIKWKAEAYNATRFDFDDYLLNLVKENTNTTIFESVDIRDITRKNAVELIDKTGEHTFTCSLLIACDGANSIAKRTLVPELSQQSLTGYAIRSYYSNVDCVDNTNEFYLLDDFPGYFWIFPLTNNQYNVGVGLLNPPKNKKDFDIKKAMQNVIDTHPIIREKFKKSKPVSKVQGFKLPLGGNCFPVSMDRVFLAGDAGHMIDPLQGHGIDKAMESGILAASHAIKCFKLNRFDGIATKPYDAAIQQTIGRELKRNLRVMRLLFKFPIVLRISAYIASYNRETVLKIFYKKRKQKDLE